MNENQIKHRLGQIAGVLIGIDLDDQQTILNRYAEQLSIRISNMPSKSDEPESFAGDIKRAIASGLRSGDPQMVRAAMEWQAEADGRNYPSKLEVSIVPYRIKDDSLARIVLEAGDDKVAEIEEALRKRRGV